jgi:hypothetical protein
MGEQRDPLREKGVLWGHILTFDISPARRTGLAVLAVDHVLQAMARHQFLSA